MSIKATMNLGLSEKLKTAFPDIENIQRPLVKELENLDPNWIAGFVCGEGCFFVNIFKSNTKLGETVRLVFKLT